MGVWPDRTYKFPWNLDPLTIFGWSCKEGKTSAKRNWQQITHILDNEVWLVSKPVKVVLKKYIPPIYISISNSQVCADTLIKDVYICHFVELCHHSQKQRKNKKWRHTVSMQKHVRFGQSTVLHNRYFSTRPLKKLSCFFIPTTKQPKVLPLPLVGGFNPFEKY